MSLKDLDLTKLSKLTSQQIDHVTCLEWYDVKRLFSIQPIQNVFLSVDPPQNMLYYCIF